MAAERTIDIPPIASALIGSLRGLGYSPETAIADLIDNSITASAVAVEIDLQWNSGSPVAAILDNGKGMDEDRLTEAMRLGGQGPASQRDDVDLGRFGMGLKTASLSESSRGCCHEDRRSSQCCHTRCGCRRSARLDCHRT